MKSCYACIEDGQIVFASEKYSRALVYWRGRTQIPVTLVKLKVLHGKGSATENVTSARMSSDFVGETPDRNAIDS